MIVVGAHTQAFIDGLNRKFGDKYRFSAMPGRKYDRIVQESASGSKNRSVHAFIDSEGNIYKAAGWSAPAKGVRFYTVDSALYNADPYGSYLYARR